MRRHLPAATALLAIAFLVRWWFLCGLVLGDDAQEVSVLERILTSGPDFHEQLQLRFGGWILGWATAQLFGVSETTLLLPTWILSSTFGVLAYLLLVRWRYGAAHAFLGGLFVATAPFEVVLGTARTNDLYLAWTLALGFAFVVLLEHRPVLQGVLVAACLWFGFYVKLWAVYALPALALYYGAGRRWRAAGAFVVTSVLIHGTTCLYWWRTLGTTIPFVTSHAANYAVPSAELPRVLLAYPRMIFAGSEFGTTLFGAVPYLLVALLVAKGLARGVMRFDRVDGMLVAFYGSFFLLLELFPNGFELGAYYTVPRIFRYLAPISFPIALHVAKMLLDLTRDARAITVTALFVAALLVNLQGDAVATRPGRIYREALRAVVREIEETQPPAVVADITLGYWLRSLLLDPETVPVEVVIPEGIYAAKDDESWLRAREATLPTGTLLVTGLGGYVHYGAHNEGFRLAWFEAPLSWRWQLAREHDVLSYLPRPEAARVWRLGSGAEPSGQEPLAEDLASVAAVTDPAVLFTEGMRRYDRNDYAGARPYFRKLLRDHPGKAEDAAFFHAATFFREGRWARARG